MGPGRHLTRRPTAFADAKLLGTMPGGSHTRFGPPLREPREDPSSPGEVGERLGRRMLPAETRPEPGASCTAGPSRDPSGGDPVNALLEITLERVPPPTWARRCDQAHRANRYALLR